MEEVKVTLCKSVTGLTFANIAYAMDWSNVGSYIEEEKQQFLLNEGLSQVPHIFVATHSMGGRGLTLEEGRTPPPFFAEDCFNGGWDVVAEEDVKQLFCESATSGSTLEAWKNDDSTWSLELRVPFVDAGTPYQGGYWKAFHEACSGCE